MTDDIDTNPRYTRIPCGCVFGSEPLPDGGEAFVYKPCSTDCEYYLYTQRIAKEQGKPLSVVDFSDPKSVQITGSSCPTCGKYNDGATDVSGAGATPSPGDWSMCGYCFAAVVFDDQLRMRSPTIAELEEMPPQLAVLQRRAMDARR